MRDFGPEIQPIVDKYLQHLDIAALSLSFNDEDSFHFHMREATKLDIELRLIHGIAINFKEEIN